MRIASKQPEHHHRLAKNHPLVPRLIRYWTFGEGAGAPRDLVTGGRATVSGATWGTDVKGRRLLYDGTNDFMSAPIDLTGQTQITISWWLYWDVFSNDGDIALEFSPNYNNANAFYCGANSAGGFMQVSIQDQDASLYNTSDIIRPTAAEWHHIVWTMDRTAGTSQEANKVFIDGILQVRQSGGLSAMAGDFDNSTLYFMSRGGTASFGAGRIQNFAMFTGLLSTAEAVSLYRKPWQLLAEPRKIQASFITPEVYIPQRFPDINTHLAM